MDWIPAGACPREGGDGDDTDNRHIQKNGRRSARKLEVME